MKNDATLQQRSRDFKERFSDFCLFIYIFFVLRLFLFLGGKLSFCERFFWGVASQYLLSCLHNREKRKWPHNSSLATAGEKALCFQLTERI